MGDAGADDVYVCPMHPEIVRDAPGSCPVCAMKLLPASLVEAAGGSHHAGGGEHGHDPREGQAHVAGDGIEWEDDMVEVNRLTTPSNMRWQLVDRETGAVNADIDWRFVVGDRVKHGVRSQRAVGGGAGYRSRRVPRPGGASND